MSLIRGGQISGSVASASYAITASYALNGGGGGSTFPYIGNAVITGSLTVSGSGLPITTYNGITIQPVGPYLTASIVAGTFAIKTNNANNSIAIGVDNGQVGTIGGQLYTLAIGYQAGSGSSAGSSTYVGTGAGINNQGNNSTLIDGGAYNTGNQVIAIGQGAASSNSGLGTIAIGYQAGQTNNKDYLIAIGQQAGNASKGSNAILIGPLAGLGNGPTTNNVIAIGYGAGYNISTGVSNNRSNVALLGFQASASADNQLVFVRSGSGFSYNAQLDANGITADRKYTLPNSSSILVLSVNNTGSNSTGNINLTNVPSASYATTASFAVTYQTATTVTLADTASFVTGSNVYGPYGSNSIVTASYALTASYAMNGGGGGGGTLAYGSYYEAGAHTLAKPPAAMALKNIDMESGITLSGTDSIGINTSGIYNFQISVTVLDSGNNDIVDFYLYETNTTTTYPMSAKTVDRMLSNQAFLITWNCLLSLSAGDDIQLFGGSSSGTNVATATPNNGGYPITISVVKVA